jgi:hypothetical protein
LKLRKPKLPSSNVLASTKFPVRRKDVVINTSDKVEGKYKQKQETIKICCCFTYADERWRKYQSIVINCNPT